MAKIGWQDVYSNAASQRWQLRAGQLRYMHRGKGRAWGQGQSPFLTHWWAQRWWAIATEGTWEVKQLLWLSSAQGPGRDGTGWALRPGDCTANICLGHYQVAPSYNNCPSQPPDTWPLHPHPPRKLFMDNKEQCYLCANRNIRATSWHCCSAVPISAFCPSQLCQAPPSHFPNFWTRQKYTQWYTRVPGFLFSISFLFFKGKLEFFVKYAVLNQPPLLPLWYLWQGLDEMSFKVLSNISKPFWDSMTHKNSLPKTLVVA